MSDRRSCSVCCNLGFLINRDGTAGERCPVCNDLSMADPDRVRGPSERGVCPGGEGGGGGGSHAPDVAPPDRCEWCGGLGYEIGVDSDADATCWHCGGDGFSHDPLPGRGDRHGVRGWQGRRAVDLVAAVTMTLGLVLIALAAYAAILAGAWVVGRLF